MHTQYSILDGAAAIDDIVDKAVAQGMPALAITDHGAMFGVKDFHQACVKKGIKPILGCEAYLVDDLVDEKDRNNYHCILLAKNYVGYKNLLKLISTAHLKGMYYRPRIDKIILEQHKEGLIMLSACLGGEVAKTLTTEGVAAAEKSILWYKSIFQDDFYLEVMRHPTQDPQLRKEVYERQKYVNKELFKLGAKHDIKIVATNDVHFTEEQDAGAHDILICLNTGADIHDMRRVRYTRQEWFKTTDEMYELWADAPEVLANTLEVADKVEEYTLNSNPIMPEFAIPESFGTIEDYKQKYSEEALRNEFERYDNLGGYDAVVRIKFESDYLKQLTYLGAKKRYGENIPEKHKKRIDFELETIAQMGFPGYFLIVQDFIEEARNMGVLVGPGRGSAAGSVVSYCLSITNIDPIKFDLLFERFLNPDRVSMPDIDIDFDDDGRQKILDWVTEKYPDLDNVGSFTTEMGREYIAYVLSQDGSNSTKNELIKMPRRLFRLLGREGGIIENPFDGWKALPNDQEDREAFTPEELKLIGEKATGWIYSLCLTCLSTGLREGDACLLKKSNVDLKTGWLRNIKASKTGKTLDIPMMPGLEKHIRERLQEDDSSEYIFPELANRYIKQPNRIGEDIKTFFQEIGLVGTRKKVPGYRRLVSKKDVHSFRHTFVYLAALHGWPLPVVQAIVQHSSPAMTRIYMSHADAKEKEKYFRQVPEYLTGTPATKTDPIENIIRMVEQDQPKDQIISELRKVQGQLQI